VERSGIVLGILGASNSAGQLVFSFGKRNVGVIYGWVFASHMVGAAIAAFVAGVTRDLVGDYAMPSSSPGWMTVAAGIVALSIRRAGTQPAAPATAT